jgi:hypothetical protein
MHDDSRGTAGVQRFDSGTAHPFQITRAGWRESDRFLRNLLLDRIGGVN